MGGCVDWERGFLRRTVREPVYDADVTALSVRALLFTDIEGSTTLVRRLGERYEGVLDRHHEIIRTSAAGWSGSEQSSGGDSLFITFASAAAALEGAVDAQRRIEREPWPPDGRVRVRMGVHIGEVAESRAGLVGLAIHKAARIAGAAHGGQVIVSGDVLREASSFPTDVTTRSLGTHDLRGIGQVSLYQVEHPDLQHEFPKLRTRRAMVHNLPAPLTSLVGRAAEAGTVTRLLDEHRLVTLLGEGGCGKTRLSRFESPHRGWAASSTASGLSISLPCLEMRDVTSRLAEVLGVQGGLDELVAGTGTAGGAARPRQLRARGRIDGDRGHEVVERVRWDGRGGDLARPARCER